VDPALSSRAPPLTRRRPSATFRGVSARVLGFTFVLLATLAGCKRVDHCVATCESRRLELHCPAESRCQATCDQLHGTTTCVAEFKAFETCLLAITPYEWTCDFDGQPIPRLEACPKQHAAVVRCLGNPTASPPAPAPTGPGTR